MTTPNTPGATPLPSESDVRELVAAIVDGVIGQEPYRPEVGGSSPEPAPASPPSSGEPEAAGTRIAVGADHGGYPLKERLLFRLREAGYDVVDCGTDSPESVDYPVFAAAVARKVADGSCTWGIVVDGAGIGSAMVANKVPGVRAALCYDLSTARNSREHNHANVLTLGAGLIGDGLAWQIVQEWLAVPWGGDRHARRVAMITDLEQEYSKR
jgi:ribose 5-phosphate isomerase B